jgi:prepilin-type N-terminal cleavage/methylation domain-containing protein
VDGFTLVETIVTIGLIAVIATFVIPTVVQQAESAAVRQPQYRSSAAQRVASPRP